MASSAVITFDTTPPTVSAGSVLRLEEAVSIPYTVDEPCLIEVVATADGNVIDVVIDEENSRFLLADLDANIHEIDLDITAVDDVDNESSTTLTIRLVEAVAGVLEISPVLGAIFRSQHIRSVLSADEFETEEIIAGAVKVRPTLGVAEFEVNPVVGGTIRLDIP